MTLANLAANQWLKIGEVASNSNLSVKTIRYYDDIGLLAPSVKRSSSGYRLFDESIFNRLAFIKRAQSLGLNLNEIQEILTVHDEGKLPCGVVKKRLLQKLKAIEEQIQSLTILKSELQGILCGWKERPNLDKIADTICPNLQSDV